MDKVVFIHSAAIDDFVSTAVVSAMENVQLEAILVINADCVAQPAMEVTSRVHQFLGLQEKGIPIALSNARGWNAFPWGYRSDCIRMGGIDILSDYTSKWQFGAPEAETILTDILLDASVPITVLCTGPIATLTNVLSANTSLVSKVGNVIWMGGAIQVPGNLDGGNPTKTPMKIPQVIANKYAEWNIFFDPFAAEQAFQLLSNIKQFPLDITDQAKITDSFKARLLAQAESGFRLSQFVNQAYALVAAEPFYEMWNTCATCWLAQDADIFDGPSLMKLLVDTWGNDSQGRITVATSNAINDQDVYLSLSNPENFYAYVLEQLRS